MQGRPPVNHIAHDTSLAQHISSLPKVTGGFMKDFIRKVLIAKDEPWWNKESSEWKISAVHPWAPENAYTPDYWEERVMDLCSYDITRSNFGLGYLDLMELDPATFEKIEKKVHEIASRQQAALAREGIGGNNDNYSVPRNLPGVRNGR